MPPTSSRDKSESPEAVARACLKRCKKYIAALRDHPESQPFRRPVDPERDLAPDYYQVIKRPMDLKTISERLTAGYYWTPFEVDADVRLMVDNCLLYNARVPLFCNKAQALQAMWNNYFWSDHSITREWESVEAALYQVVPEEQLYWRPPLPPDEGALQRYLEAAAAEVVRAAAWLQPPLTLHHGSRTARLLGGHHSSPAGVWTACECTACRLLPLTLAPGGRMMTLQELHDHWTAAPPGAPALDTQQLLRFFQVGAEAAAAAARVQAHDMLSYLRARSQDLGGENLVLRDVWVYWCGCSTWPPPDPPEVGTWRTARIVCYDDITGEHLLRYPNPQGPKAKWLPCFRAYLPITFHHSGLQPPEFGQAPSLLGCPASPPAMAMPQHGATS